jgi:hypothetical protein
MNALKTYLKLPLKARNEQRFIYSRLQLFDEEFVLDRHRHLWQSYLDMGLQQQPEFWPVSKSYASSMIYYELFILKNEVYRMAKTNESNVCKQYIIESWNQTKNHLELCRTKLSRQAQLCVPTTLLPLSTLDLNLKQFVREQNKPLFEKVNKQLVQYKEVVEENKLFQELSGCLTSNDQVCQ